MASNRFQTHSAEKSAMDSQSLHYSLSKLAFVMHTNLGSEQKGRADDRRLEQMTP